MGQLFNLHPFHDTYCKIIHRLCLAFAFGPNRKRRLRRNSRRRHANENNLIETPSRVQSVARDSVQGGDQERRRSGQHGLCRVLGGVRRRRVAETVAKLCPRLPCLLLYRYLVPSTLSTCPLCRMDVLYDFSSCSSSVSAVALLVTLQREDPYEERPLGHRLLDTVTAESRVQVQGNKQPLETDSHESVPAISPIIVPNRIARENQLELPQNHKGESSMSERYEQAMSPPHEVPC